MISDILYLTLLLPLWIFLIVMLGRFFSVYVNKKIIHGISLFSSAFGAVSCLGLYKIFTLGTVYETSFPIIKINDFVISCGIYIDRISVIFATVLFAVSFFIQLFSISHMKDEKKQYRFWALINLFNFSLAGLFFSPNLYQTYVFWEIAGIISYLLIGFEYYINQKSKASAKVFIMNRIGDTAMIGAIIICSYIMYEYAPAKSLTTLDFYDLNIISTLFSAYTSTALFITVCLLFLIGASVKSAQIPFYTWLQDAMEAKLPVSALLHSATLVAIGVYIIIRLMPFFTFSDILLKILVVIGLLTAIICSLCACAQDNPKKVLAYSTSAQIGLMFYSIGLLNIKAAICLFCAHAVTKSLLFITLPRNNEKWNYWNAFAFAIGSLSLTGLILTGTLSKGLLTSTLSTKSLIILSIIVLLTGFYITRLGLMLWYKNGITKDKPDKIEFIAQIGLLTLNIALSLYMWKFTKHSSGITYLTGGFGCLLAYILYLKHAFYKIPVIYTLCYNGFYLDDFYTKFVRKIYNTFSCLLAKFDSDVLDNYSIIKSSTIYCVKLVHNIEENVMNRIVSLVAKFVKDISEIDLRGQTGNIQQYNLYAFIMITLITTCLLIVYTAITTYF